MPFNRAALNTLIERTSGDIEARLPGSEARLRRAMTNVLARVHSGATHGLYGYLDWLSLQLMPDTAEQEHLERWGAIWGVARRLAVAATGNVEMTGIDGVVIPAGTLLQRSDEVEYTTDADATIDNGVATAQVTAATAGAAGNAAAGIQANLVAPVAGVQSQAVVAADGLTGGNDAETDTELRAQLLKRIQQPPHGGAKHDYDFWAVAGHPDVTRVWVEPLGMGLGTVVVRIMTDDATADGIPTQAVLDDVTAYTDIERPVCGKGFYIVAPIPAPLDITITGITPSTQEVQDAVDASIKDLLRREAEPGSTILISHIREAISIAAGEHDHAVTVPAGDVTHAAGEIATPGVITWA